MVQTLNREDFLRAMHADSPMRGQFMTQISPGEWMGLENPDGNARLYMGPFRQVIETFVPYNGVTVAVSGIMDGIRRTADRAEWVSFRDVSSNSKRSVAAHPAIPR